MTVTSNTASITHQGNGVTTAFAWNFLIPSAADLVVTLYDTTVTPETVETLTPSLYVATGLNVVEGGSIAFPLSGDPVSAGQYVTIYRDLSEIQDVTLRTQPRFFPAAFETGLDYITGIFQDVAVDIVQAQSSIGRVWPPVDPGQSLSVSDFTATLGSFGVLTDVTAGIGAATIAAATAGLITATTGTIGTADITTAVIGDLAATVVTITDLSLTGSFVQTGFAPVAAVSGATVTLSATENFTALNLTQSAAALTVHLPAAPVHGQEAAFSIDQAVTTLSVTASDVVNNVPLTTVSQDAGTAFGWIFSEALGEWLRRTGGIKSSSNLLQYLTATASVNFDNTTAGTSTTSTGITVTGAVMGDYVLVSGESSAIAFNTQAFVKAQVTAPDTVVLRFCNLGTVDRNPTAITMDVVVLPKSQFGL